MKRTIPSLAPARLVSVPQLRDPNFDRTVVLLLVTTGSMGLVVNRDDHPCPTSAPQDLDYSGPGAVFGGPSNQPGF